MKGDAWNRVMVAVREILKASGATVSYQPTVVKGMICIRRARLDDVQPKGDELARLRYEHEQALDDLDEVRAFAALAQRRAAEVGHRAASLARRIAEAQAILDATPRPIHRVAIGIAESGALPVVAQQSALRQWCSHVGLELVAVIEPGDALPFSAEAIAVLTADLADRFAESGFVLVASEHINLRAQEAQYPDSKLRRPSVRAERDAEDQRKAATAFAAAQVEYARAVAAADSARSRVGYGENHRAGVMSHRFDGSLLQ